MLKPTRINEKQVALVDAYFRLDFNKAAAMRSVGYSDCTAKQSVNQVFGNPFVRAEIEKRMAENRKNFQLSEKWVIERLMTLADGNLGALLAKLKEYDWNLDALSAEEQYLLTEYTEESGPGGPKRKVKISDRIASLVSLARHLGMFKDQIELSGGVSLVEKLQRGREQARLAKAADGEQQ